MKHPRQMKTHPDTSTDQRNKLLPSSYQYSMGGSLGCHTDTKMYEEY